MVKDWAKMHLLKRIPEGRQTDSPIATSIATNLDASARPNVVHARAINRFMQWLSLAENF
jgi:hypothetical protein